MLHPPGAHPGALLSVTVKPLPITTNFQYRPLAPDWYLIVVRHGITFGEIVRAYHWNLPTWARSRLYTTLGVTDPAVDLADYHCTRWWPEGRIITTATEELVAAAGEAAGLLVPLPRGPEQIAS